MPIYEYRCTSCGDLSEVLQKVHDKPLTKCKKCGGKLEKLISRTSFQLKGSGWYVTDYGRKGRSGGEGGESSGKSSGGDSSDSSSSSSSGSGSSASGGSSGKKSKKGS